MKKLTHKQAFYKGVQGVFQQGKPCVDYYGDCIYDDGNGNHCAIGWIEPDLPDGCISTDKVNTVFEKKTGLVYRMWMRQLQLAHDDMRWEGTGIDSFMEESAKIAEQEGFVYEGTL